MTNKALIVGAGAVAVAVAVGFAVMGDRGPAEEEVAVAEPSCEIDRPIVLAGLNWDSNEFHNQVAKYILENGYDCETTSIPGSTVPLLNGMIGGDIDVTMEVWIENVRAQWEGAIANNQVRDLGTNFPDAVQGWWVPRYLVEGPDAPAPDLKSVYDLPAHKELFSDPEEPEKGRFYNCVIGWGCEVVNTKKYYAYGLEEHYTNFRPGAGAAFSSAIEAAFKREAPIVFYYWGPTWIMGKYDMVQLEEPAFDPEIWAAMNEAERPTEVVAYPVVSVPVGVNQEFYDAAPTLVEFLTKYETTNDLVSQALSYMQDTDSTPEEAAINFLQTQEELWTQWVPADVADKVKAALTTGT